MGVDVDGSGALAGGLEAIEDANEIGGGLIRFAIPGSGPYTIHLATPLPDVTSPALIDATTHVDDQSTA